MNVNVDINDFHCLFSHVHEGRLHETAKQGNVNFTDALRECQGCSIAKGRAKPTATSTETRAVKPGGRAFLDTSGEEECSVHWGEEAHRLNVVYFLRSKDEVTKYFSQYLVDYRFSGVPFPVEVIRTDDAV